MVDEKSMAIMRQRINVLNLHSSLSCTKIWLKLFITQLFVVRDKCFCFLCLSCTNYLIRKKGIQVLCI